MEIGSAYALQVCLLQIPAMVAFSAWYNPASMGAVAKTFSYVSINDCNAIYLISPLKTHFPAMGRNSHNPRDVPYDLYIHRGEEQLSSRKHPSAQVTFRANLVYIISSEIVFLAILFYYLASIWHPIRPSMSTKGKAWQPPPPTSSLP